MNAPIETLLLDLDGTVIDTVELILSSYEHVRVAHLADRDLDDDHFRLRIGIPLWGVFGELVDDRAEVDRLVEAYRTHNLGVHDTMVRAYDDMPEVLAALRARGVRTGIVTSKLREAALRGIEIGGVAAHLETVVALDDVTHHKPHPEPLLKAMAALGAVPARTLYVGDAPADLGAGRAAGVRTGAALWGPFSREQLAPHRPDHWLERPGDIAAVVARTGHSRPNPQGMAGA